MSGAFEDLSDVPDSHDNWAAWENRDGESVDRHHPERMERFSPEG